MSQDDASSMSKASHTTGKPVEDLPKVDWHKKATLIFLGSVGVTLLLTGATGSRMMKKPPTAAPHATTIPPRVVAAKTSPSTSSQLPLAFIKRIPGTSVPPRKSSSRLRHLFQTSPAPVTTSLDFVANQHAPWKKELPKPNLLGSMVDTEDASIPEPAPEDKVNALLDAVKAFTLATTITVGSAAAGVFFLSQYLGATDIPTFMDQLRHQIMQPFARSVASSDFLPNFLKLKEKPRTAESIKSEQEDEEELRQIFERGWKDLLKQTGQKDEGETNLASDNVVEIRKV